MPGAISNHIIHLVHERKRGVSENRIFDNMLQCNISIAIIMRVVIVDLIIVPHSPYKRAEFYYISIVSNDYRFVSDIRTRGEISAQ